jgi:hypothetical protein
VVVESVLKGILPSQKEKEIIRQMFFEGDP